MKQVIIVVIAIVCFISCKKSDSSSTTPVNPPAAGDSTTLVKLVVLDSTKTAPFDSATIYRFEYDNTKRLTKTTALVYNTTNNLLETAFTFTYFYSGADTLPHRVAEYNHPTSTITLNWNHELGFDAQARMIRDSSNEVLNSNTNVYTNKYTYLTDGFLDSSFAYIPSNSVSGNKTIVTKDAGNNIIKQKPDNSATATEIVYDNKVNPLYKTSVRYPYLLNSTYPCFFSGVNITVQKNNFTKISTNTYDAAGTTILASYNTNFNITYKANGLPSVIRISSTPTAIPSKDKYKYLFYYSN